MTLYANVREQLLAQDAADPSPGHEQAQLNNALRLLAKWRPVCVPPWSFDHR